MLVQELFQLSQNVQILNSVDTAKSLPEAEVKIQLSKLPRPDVAQMLPFKPKILARKYFCCHVFFYILASFVCRCSEIWMCIRSLVLHIDIFCSVHHSLLCLATDV